MITVEARAIRHWFATAKQAPVLLAFDRTNPAAVAWAEARAAELVTRIAADTRLAIRALIARAFREGLTTAQTSRLIQDVVGFNLRPDQMATLSTVNSRLVRAEARARATGQTQTATLYTERIRRGPARGQIVRRTVRVPPRGVGAARFDRLRARLTRRLLRQRAVLIARTETAAAAIQGQQALWDQNAQAGLLRGNELQEWVVANDERLCLVCRPMNGVKVPRGQPFQTSLGPVTGPPAHPACRCALVLAFPGAGARVPRTPGRAEERAGPTAVMPTRSMTQQEVLARMPAAERQLIGNGGVTIDVTAGAQTTTGASSAFGYYDQYGRRIVVAEGTMMSGGGTMAHELGHAVDNMMVGGGQPGRWFWSDGDRAYQAALGADLKGIATALRGTEYKRLVGKLYSQSQVGREIFADLYASQRMGFAVRGGAYSVEEITAMFPHAGALIRDLVIGGL